MSTAAVLTSLKVVEVKERASSGDIKSLRRLKAISKAAGGEVFVDWVGVIVTIQLNPSVITSSF